MILQMKQTAVSYSAHKDHVLKTFLATAAQAELRI